jgi:hypothetical protein
MAAALLRSLLLLWEEEEVEENWQFIFFRCGGCQRF